MPRLLRKKRFWAGLLGLAVVIAGVVIWAGQSGQGTIIAPPSQAAVTVTPSYQTLNGQYVTFQYKGIYQSQKQPVSGNDLEIYLLSADTDYQKQLAVSVSQLPGGSLAANSAYALRSSDPADYSKRQEQVPAGMATIWTKADGLDQTAFVPHGTNVAVFSFSTYGTVDTNLSNEVDMLLQSLQWK